MRLGVVVNPFAGRGVDGEVERLVKLVVERLGEAVLAGEKDLGEKYLEKYNVKPVRIQRSYSGWDTTQLVKAMDGEVDIIVVFGGDGTASDAASAMPETPLLCIGTGTTNAGWLITPPGIITSQDFSPERLKIVETDALLLKETGRLAFNDIAAGSTVLTTIGDRIVHVDAERFMKGEKAPCSPKKFRARVTVNGKIIEGIFGNVFVNLTSESFLGKGTAGGAAISTFVGFPAVIGCVSLPIVVADYTKELLREAEPIETTTLSLDYGEEAIIECDTIISADGNPQLKGKATVSVIEKAVRVLKVRDL
jgi:predicted polyphosphate/ATP-dependent NAD kinase